MKLGVLFALLVLAVSSTQQCAVRPHCRGSFPGWSLVGKRRCVKGFPYPCIKGRGILGHLDYFSRGIKGKCGGNVIDILRDVAVYKLPGTFDNALTLIINIGRACGGLVNVIIGGLGDLLGDLVIAIIRIIVCGLGSPSFFGVRIPDRRPDYGGVDVCSICSPDYGKRWGWKLWKLGYKQPGKIIDFYGIKEASKTAQSLIKKATKGRGIDCLPSSQKLIVTWILDLCALIERDIKIWTRRDLVTLYVKVTSIIGVLGHCYQRGLGVRIVDGISVYIKSNFEIYGLDEIDTSTTKIKETISKCTTEGFEEIVEVKKEEYTDVETTTVTEEEIVDKSEETDTTETKDTTVKKPKDEKPDVSPPETKPKDEKPDKKPKDDKPDVSPPETKPKDDKPDVLPKPPCKDDKPDTSPPKPTPDCDSGKKIRITETSDSSSEKGASTYNKKTDESKSSASEDKSVQAGGQICAKTVDNAEGKSTSVCASGGITSKSSAKSEESRKITEESGSSCVEKTKDVKTKKIEIGC